MQGNYFNCVPFNRTGAGLSSSTEWTVDVPPRRFFMRLLQIAFCMIGTSLCLSAQLFAQCGLQLGQGQAVVTVSVKGSGEEPVKLTSANLQIKIGGKAATVTGLKPLRGAANRLELVVLMDSSSRSSLGEQLGAMARFVRETPSGTKIAIAYMENGQAVLATPLTDKPAEAEKGIHLPSGSSGSSANPWFCLTDLARHWPSQDKSARREVLMITDGVDPYNPRFDADDPYVNAAIADSVRAGLVVDSIYWSSKGAYDNTQAGSTTGQNLLSMVSDATGGKSYWQGMGNPVSFDPYFDDLRHRLRDQYLLSFSAPLKGKAEVVPMQLKVSGAEVKVDAPRQVLVAPAGEQSSKLD
jgi:hypothetical protein